MTELLPCPFCGKSWLSHWLDKETRTMFLKCQDCGACGPGVSTLREVDPPDVSDKALAAQALWNTRAPQILELTARVSGNTIELSGVPQVSGALSISWELVGEVDNA